MTKEMNRRDAIKRASLMLGASISASTLAGIGCGGGGADSRAAGSSLNSASAAIASAVADRILPKTDTPGALDVGVPDFISRMYAGFMTAEEKRVFDAGLSDLDNRARKDHNKGFADLDGEQKDALIRAMATNSQDQPAGFLGKLRELVLVGYYTSEEVATTLFRYDPIPGMHDGCIPLGHGEASFFPA